MLNATPPTTAGLLARLEAIQQSPFPPTEHSDLEMPTPGLAGQKLAADLRAIHPPISQQQLAEVRAMMPELISIGEKWSTTDDFMTSFGGFAILGFAIGIGLGLRRVPLSILVQMNLANAAASTDLKTMSHIMAGMLRQAYPAVTDEEHAETLSMIPWLIESGEMLTRGASQAVVFMGMMMLTMAGGMLIADRKVPVSIMHPYLGME